MKRWTMLHCNNRAPNGAAPHQGVPLRGSTYRGLDGDTCLVHSVGDAMAPSPAYPEVQR